MGTTTVAVRPTGGRVAVRMLVTGATGYIGGRLVSRLLADAHHVRAAARDRGRLRDLPWRLDVEVVCADVIDSAAVRAALTGVDVAYYLPGARNRDEATVRGS